MLAFGGQYGYYKDYSGRYLLGHRYYDAGAGRFVTRDPLGYQGGLNLYGFAGNNPVNESDPSGYIPLLRQHSDPGIDWAKAGRALQAGIQQVGDFLSRNIGPTVDVYSVGQHDPCGCGPNLFDQQAQHLENAQAQQSMSMMKRGPKPQGTGLHNNKITERIGQIQKEHTDWVHEGGGSETEETVLTPGGFKSSRRPDITFRKSNGAFYRENVGRTFKDGSPITRERRALDDLEKATGTRPTFTPYDR